MIISIIIPVLNEVENIENSLRHISENTSGKSITEIIVIDGGSKDGTIKAILDYAAKSKIEIHCISSQKGRAKQMNLGATIARGDILYFLHADSNPPKGFDFDIISEVKNSNEAGCFRLKFDSSHPILKISQWFTRFNLKVCRGGDQSLYITKDLFNKLSGYNENYTIYEDCELTNRIYDRFNFKIIPKNIITSSRKYSKIGTCKLQYYFTMVHIKNRLGATPQELYDYYKKYIAS